MNLSNHNAQMLGEDIKQVLVDNGFEPISYGMKLFVSETVFKKLIERLPDYATGYEKIEITKTRGQEADDVKWDLQIFPLIGF